MAAKSKQTKRAVSLFFPASVTRKPLMFETAVAYHLLLNIFWARVGKDGGTATIEFQGTEDDIDRALRSLEKKGVKVEPVTGQVVFE